jgi:hypothetical protein
MSDSSQVRRIDAFSALRTSLLAFAADAREVLLAADAEVQRTLDWIAERQRFWQAEVRRRQEALQQAQAALARCEASGSYDRDGHYQPPNCSREEHEIMSARLLLAEAEDELRKVLDWKRLLESGATDYRREATALRQRLEGELPKATALLQQSREILQSYVAMQAPATAAVPSTTFRTPSPVQAVGETVQAGLSAAVAGVGLGGVGVAVLKWLASNPQKALGDMGEVLSERLLKEQFGWQTLPLDQAKHGFDRVMRAPGHPVIVVESKVSHDGQFHPGQTAHGEQGSPGWIRATGASMSDAASAQWSPANERIAALVQELGPENVPAVAVVIESLTGAAEVYYRVGANDWSALASGVSLADVLGLWMPPEFKEGAVGGPERKG